MFIYLIVFWFLAVVAVLMELKLTQRARLSLLVFCYLLLVLFVGLRWETGNDWGNYYLYYTHLTSLKYNPLFFEVGYRIFSLATKDVGLSFAGFNLIYAAIYLGLMFLSFKEEAYAISGWLALQLYSPFILGLMGTTRQVMATAICMFSVRYVLSKNWSRFLLCVGIATTFHVSALAFLIAWPLSRARLNLRRVWIIFFALTIASLLHIGDRAVKYAEDKVAVFQLVDLGNKLALERESSPEEFHPAAGAATLVVETAGRVGVLALIILGFRLYSNETDQLYFKFYLFSVIIIVLLSGTVYVLAGRVAIYFSIYQIHLLALPTRRIKIPAMRHLCCIALVVLSFSRLWTGIYLRHPRVFVPYKGVFINQDVKRDLGWFEH